MEITKEVTDIEDQLSKLDLLWLDEQRRTIAALGDEIIALNKEKSRKEFRLVSVRSVSASSTMRYCRIITSSYLI